MQLGFKSSDSGWESGPLLFKSQGTLRLEDSYCGAKGVSHPFGELWPSTVVPLKARLAEARAAQKWPSLVELEAGAAVGPSRLCCIEACENLHITDPEH